MRLIKNRKGQGTVEYAVIVAIIVIAAFLGFQKLSGKTSKALDAVGTQLDNSIKTPGTGAPAGG